MNTPEANPETNADPAWTVKRLLTWTTEYFDRHQLDEPRLAAEILLSRALECDRIALYTRFDRLPDPDQLARFRDHVKKASAHTPIAYLVGQKEFFSLIFAVSPAVLVPRPETEMLVQQAIEMGRAVGGPIDILDVGVGSGCIAVTVAKNLPSSRVVATDISPEAIDVARTNAERHGVIDRIRFAQVDRLALPDELLPESGFDLIVSNPPYVGASEMASLPANVRDHEPRAALTDESDGLSYYRVFAEGAAQLLKPSGAILLEIADGQCDLVTRLFDATGDFLPDGVWRDVGGGPPRVLRFRRVDRG